MSYFAGKINAVIIKEMPGASSTFFGTASGFKGDCSQPLRRKPEELPKPPRRHPEENHV
jgi:hypothetical protein